MKSDLQCQIDFITEIDALKSVQRKTYLMDGSRFETSAEHSWAVATLALLLAEHAPEGTKMQRVIEMLLIHDVVEVDAGDALLYDEAANQAKAEREQQAATRLFGLLPEAQAERFERLWQEFEAQQTPEALFANALDRFIPLLHNLHTKGRAWRQLGVRYEQVIDKNQKIGKASPELWQYVKERIDLLFAGRPVLPSRFD